MFTNCIYHVLLCFVYIQNVQSRVCTLLTILIFINCWIKQSSVLFLQYIYLILGNSMSIKPSVVKGNENPLFFLWVGNVEWCFSGYIHTCSALMYCLLFKKIQTGGLAKQWCQLSSVVDCDMDHCLGFLLVKACHALMKYWLDPFKYLKYQ